ncbi:MAG: GFA family protein [Candidatus Binatia bacterium]
MSTPATGGGTGRCLCGAVRYRYEGEPTTIGLCQCNRCQRQSGSAFLIGVIFPTDAAIIEGPLATYEASIDGEQRLQRHFCPTCGSAISITLDRYPEIRSMMSGTLDDTRAYSRRASASGARTANRG